MRTVNNKLIGSVNDKTNVAHALINVTKAVSKVTKEKETNKIYKIYMIEVGDCLSIIAMENDTTVDEIVALNG